MRYHAAMASSSRPVAPRADRKRREFAEAIAHWRRLLRLTQEQVAQRAGVSRSAYVRLERGEPGVSLDVVMRVLTIMRLADSVVEALDPLNTDLGRARAGQDLPRRVRR